ncbi:hypothetical protein BIW11_10089 [Tropilaelaps mercedesae]|uniref:Uncharacterized protein n=1 Tax=Tropilaelaps mercedesae TaxID=418985 RepID=A0A1V9XH87_9ACAR|nr:hypothetical protein BIW11_10089 [Tropilaelaps mercedesae]
MAALTADGPARGAILSLNPDRQEGQIKVNRADLTLDVIPFSFSDVTIDKRYLSDLQTGLIVSFTIRTSPMQQKEKPTLYRRATYVTPVEDMEFFGVVSNLNYSEETGILRVEGLSTSIGFRLIHMPPDTDFNLIRKGDHVRIETGFWNFVSARKPPQPNAVMLIGEAAERQRGVRRGIISPSKHYRKEDNSSPVYSPRIPRKSALRRSNSNSNLELRADNFDVSEQRSHARSHEEPLPQRPFQGGSHDVCCHSIGSHSQIYPSSCMMSQHVYPTANLSDAHTFPVWNGLRSLCQASRLHHPSSASFYHPSLHQSFPSHHQANLYQGNPNFYQGEPDPLVGPDEGELPLLRGQSRKDGDMIIEMTVKELRDMMRKARARQL